MPLYIEYDKTDGSVKRLLTADTLPANIAYLAYQEIPEDLEIDMSLDIKDIIGKIMEVKKDKSETQIPKINEDEPEIIEV